MMLPINQVTFAVGRVLLPALSRHQERRKAVAEQYMLAVRLTAACLFPITVGMACVAKPLVVVALGSEWSPMAGLLTILAASGPPQVLAGTTGSLYQAMNASGMLFRRGLILCLATLVAIAGGAPWGAHGIAIALFIRFYILLPTTLRAPMGLVDLRLSQMFHALIGVTVATLSMAGALLVSQQYFSNITWNTLLIHLVVGSIVYLACLRYFDRTTWTYARRHIPFAPQTESASVGELEATLPNASREGE
jgi:O-antigen/teichoic acid export membrane protein